MLYHWYQSSNLNDGEIRNNNVEQFLEENAKRKWSWMIFCCTGPWSVLRNLTRRNLSICREWHEISTSTTGLYVFPLNKSMAVFIQFHWQHVDWDTSVNRSYPPHFAGELFLLPSDTFVLKGQWGRLYFYNDERLDVWPHKLSSVQYRSVCAAVCQRSR